VARAEAEKGHFIAIMGVDIVTCLAHWLPRLFHDGGDAGRPPAFSLGSLQGSILERQGGIAMPAAGPDSIPLALSGADSAAQSEIATANGP
jgi:hypothetical protein